MRYVVLLLSLVAAATVHSSPSLEDYGSLPVIQRLSISPDGKHIAFRKVANGQDQLIVVDLETRKPANALDVSSIKLRDIRFVNNDYLLLWVSEHRRVEGFRGKFDVSTVFSFNFRTSKLSQLLKPGDGVVYPGQTGLGKVAGVSADGEYLFMPAFSKDANSNDQRAVPNYSLLKVRIDGTGKPKIQKGSHHAAIDFFVDEQGEILAREDFIEAEQLHRILVRRGDGKWEEIFSDNTDMVRHSFVGLTADRQKLVMIDTAEDTGRNVYYTLSLADGTTEGPILGREDADVENVMTDWQRVIQGVQYSGLLPSYQFFDEQLDQRIKTIQQGVPEHAVHIVDNSPDWKHFVVKVEGSQAPGDFYLSSEGAELVFMASAYPNIQPTDVHPLGRVAFGARDGMKIPTLLTIPRPSAGAMKNLPAVIMPHGGPASYDAFGFDFLAQALAAQGYLVIMPQFRGSTGFGWEHRVAGHGEWGRKMQDDISDAVAFFAGKGMIDPARVCIVGASYGGYAALAGGAFTPELYRCVVSINGIGDLDDFHGWIKREQGNSSQSLAYWEMQLGGAEDYTKDEARARSPEHAAASFVAPVLLLASKLDETVPVAQSRDMRDALNKQQKVVEYLELEGDDHYLSLSETRLQALNALVGFVNRQLQP